MAETEDLEMEERITYNALFATVPIRALNLSCRRKLAMALNPKMPLPSTHGYTRDWQGLVEAIGYPYEMNKLLGNRDDPTMALLDIWEKHASNPTIANLLEFLQTIERFDVIVDIMPLLERDTQHYLKNEEDSKRLQEKPIQVPIVTSEKQTTSAPLFTVHEVAKTQSCSVSVEESSIDEDEYVYDAYVSYVDSDIDFVYTLIEKLEGEHRLKLFVKDRDMLAGFDEASADVRIIYERCKRILLIISPEFLSDSKCEFTTMFAQALAVDNNLYARKVIPVICKPCELSVRLKYIARVDYTKRDLFGKFWDRLYYSIKNPIQGELPVAATSSSRLSPNHLGGEHSAEESLASASGGSTESLTNGTKSKRPVMTNLAPVRPVTTTAATTANGDSETDSGIFSGLKKSDKKKKKSPLSTRRFFLLGRTRNGAQTQ